MAMVVSETSGTARAMSGWATQHAAVKRKTVPEANSPQLTGPRRSRCSSMSSARPARGAVPSENMIRVSTTYVAASARMDTGTPTSIHSPKPIEIW